MDGKKGKRIERLYETLIDEKDELVENAEKLIQMIKPHIDILKANPASTAIELESVLQYQLEVSQLLVDLNLQLLKALKNIVPPVLPESETCSRSVDESHVKEDAKKNIEVADSLEECLQQSAKSLDNDELIKIICANLGHRIIPSVQSSSDPESEPTKDAVDITPRCTIDHENPNSFAMRNSCPSPSQLSETELSSSVSSVGRQHPLLNLQLTTPEVLKQCDIDDLKEDVKKFVEKLNLPESPETCKSNLPSPNFEYETPVKESAHTVTGKSSPASFTFDSINCFPPSSPHIKPTILLSPQKNNSVVVPENSNESDSSFLSFSESYGSRKFSEDFEEQNIDNSNTAKVHETANLVSKNATVTENTTESSFRDETNCSLKMYSHNGIVKSKSFNCNEVPEKLTKTETSDTTTLPNYTDNSHKYAENDINTCKETTQTTSRQQRPEKQDRISKSPEKSQTATALEKLLSKQRHNRHEEVILGHHITDHGPLDLAIQKALETMPDIRLVPAGPSRAVRSEWSGSDSGSSSSKGGGRKIKEERLKDHDVGTHQNKGKQVENSANAIYGLRKAEMPQTNEACVFSHIISPNEFYLQIINVDSVAAMDYLTKTMDEKLKGTTAEFNSKEDASSKVGKYCVGFVVSRKAWFRLEVVDWKLGNTSKDVDVKSVDYGFTTSVSYTYLRSLFRELTKIPVLAVKCYFPFLFPPGSERQYKIQEWPEESIEVMKNIANFNDSVDVCDEKNTVKWFKILFVNHDGDEAAVELAELEDQGPDPISFGEYLTQFGAAVEIINYYDDPALEEFLEDIDDLENADNVNELILGYDAQDEARICRFTRPDGTCFKGKNCRKEHVPLPEGGFTSDQLPIYRATVENLEQPVQGETLTVLITGWVNICTYLVQLVRDPVRDNDGILMDRNLKDMVATMNHPQTAQKFRQFKVAPAVGEIVLAYHTIWMRAVVRSVIRNEVGDFVSAQVYTLDFGETVNLKIRDLREMSSDFMQLPFQVIEIYLHNYEPNPTCDPKEAKRFFDNHIAYKNFQAEFRSANSPWAVKLATFKGHEIGVTLIKQGLAVKRQRDLQMAAGYALELE